MSEKTMSAAKRPAPVSSGRSSMRLTDRPIWPIASFWTPHFGGRGQDRFEDVLVPGAAAQIGRQRLPQLGFADIQVLFEDTDRQHQKAGGAEAALQPVIVPER